MSGTYGEIKNDFLEEALRIEQAGADNGIPFRIIGCLAFRIQCPEYVELHKEMGREVTDIDYISYYKHQRDAIDLFRDELGYKWVSAGFARATTLRDLFIDTERKRKVDVFYDHLDFCHKIDFKEDDRLSVEKPTIPLAELFLEKTQIVQINAKDLKDLIVLFLAHDVSEDFDDSMVNGRLIAKRLSGDWGFYYTVTQNIEKFKRFVPKVEQIDDEQADLVIGRAEKLRQLIEDEPKSMGWKLRAKIGTRKRWYKHVHSMDGERKAD